MRRRTFLTGTLGVTAAGSRASAEAVRWAPESAEYEKARALFNSDLSFQPGFIIPCRTETQVAAAVSFAAERKLPIAIKSGGHSFTGFSMNDGGVVIDLSPMSQAIYLPDQQLLHAGPGIKLGQLSDVLLPNRRLLPAGSCGGVGLGGLTLGGGYGLFARQYGLTCDHLQRVRMVDGRGTVIDSAEDEELLWACRGGGNGNFGVITHFEFVTRPAPERLGAQRFIARNLTAPKVVVFMKEWFAMAAALPDPIFSAFVLNGRQISVLLTSSFSTSGPAFRKAVAHLRKAGFTTKGGVNTPLARALKRYYGRPGPLPFYNTSGGYYAGMADLDSSALALAESVAKHPGLIFQINTLGGAIARGPKSAYPHRALPFLGEIQSYWNRKNQRESLVGAAKELRLLLGKAGITRHYRNYPDLTLKNWEQSYYGEAYPLLQGLKLRYDPDNLIRHPQSVRPGT